MLRGCPYTERELLEEIKNLNAEMDRFTEVNLNLQCELDEARQAAAEEQHRIRHWEAEREAEFQSSLQSSSRERELEDQVGYGCMLARGWILTATHCRDRWQLYYRHKD